jgi:hypothetical protein
MEDEDGMLDGRTLRATVYYKIKDMLLMLKDIKQFIGETPNKLVEFNQEVIEDNSI